MNKNRIFLIGSYKKVHNSYIEDFFLYYLNNSNCNNKVYFKNKLYLISSKNKFITNY